VTDDAILQARLDLLLTNLTRASGVPEMLDSQRHDLARLLELLSTERSSERGSLGEMPGLKRNLEKAHVDLKVLADDPEFGEAVGRLTHALTSLDTLQKKLDEAATIVEHLHRRRVAAAENLSRGTVVMELKRDAQDFIRRVEQLLKPNGQDAQLGAEIWRTYTDLLEQIGPRFDECVDLLQGVSAREHGLEDTSAALFELADTMVASWRLTDFNSDSFTIPSRSEIEARGRITVLRVGFSEWSVWTLPLVAFEFGRLAVHRSHSIQNFLTARHADDVAGWETLMADGLATAAVGPAYACAAVILRLQPPRPDHPADHDRVRMILLTLAKLNPGGAYDHVIDGLQTAWGVASAAAGPAALPGSRPEAELVAAVDFLFDQVGTNVLFVYPRDEFDRAGDMADRIMKQIRGEPAPALGPDDIGDVRNLMNLAWLCRLDHPSEHAAVAERVLQLWSDLQAFRRRPATSGGRALRTVATSQRGGRI
jgi:hypothetical protein